MAKEILVFTHLESLLSHFFHIPKPVLGKDYEFLVGLVTLGYFYSTKPDKKWVLGLPVKSKYVKEVKLLKTFTEFLRSNYVEESTFTDFGISEIVDGALAGGIYHYQLKSYGRNKKITNTDGLIEMLDEYRKLPKQDISLIINLMNESIESVDLSKIRAWLDGVYYPYPQVIIVYTQVNRKDDLDVAFVFLHPVIAIRRYTMLIGSALKLTDDAQNKLVLDQSDMDKLNYYSEPTS